MKMDFSDRMQAINRVTRDRPEADAIPKDLSEEEQLEIVKQLSLKQHEEDEKRREKAGLQLARLADGLTFDPPQPVEVPRRGSRGRNSPKRTASPSTVPQVPGLAPRNISFGEGIAEASRIPGARFEDDPAAAAAAAGASRLGSFVSQSSSAASIGGAEAYPELGPPGGHQGGDDDLQRALMLSRNPLEQMSGEMRELFVAMEESKRSVGGTGPSKEDLDLQRALAMSK